MKLTNQIQVDILDHRAWFYHEFTMTMQSGLLDCYHIIVFAVFYTHDNRN